MDAEASGHRTKSPSVIAEPRGGARAWIVWAVAAATMFLAMFHRNALGVVALDAQERFGVGPGLLSLLPVVQLVVYTVLQIPVGLLADRWGPKRTLLAGTTAMAVGVVVFALAPTASVAIAARMFIGVGDTVAFLCVIRLGALWFPRSRYALIAALTGAVGGLGQMASGAPFVLALSYAGWTAAFLGAAGVSVLVAVLLLLVVRDRPKGQVPAVRDGTASILAGVFAVTHIRGVRLGMANHAMMQSPFCMLGALWGYPYLVQGYGLSPATAGLVITMLGVGSLWLPPLIGLIVGRRPRFRGALAVAIGVLHSTGWILVVAWPGGAPLTLVVIVFGVFAASMVIAAAVSFDFARDGVPSDQTGLASAVVNVVGFGTAILTTLAAGLILEAVPGTDAAAFQTAFLPAAGACVLASAAVMVFLFRYREEPAGRGRAAAGAAARASR